ncbi:MULTISPECIES: MFS transporter [unclassified Acinetobacter]|uniref:MFS transporter n=1 Tax=unclassified Acinetobacter TaxID=196816 RepID=UPI0029349878|nr:MULTISPECIES: MFS transporter [unclassified Acinetobacter]WOE33339.1 MFS transporter [Acinetobacter sp. SAAs470]WOE37002.1 MFS transporter [Acinetobacter sp. SAAs474]
MSIKWLILAITVGLYLPVAIDATVLHIAIPTLSQTLNATTAQLLWIIDIYPLLMAGLILVMGALGDRIGYRKLMLMGSIIFAMASVLAAFSTTANFLILSRAILACGAAMIMPATLACIRHTFNEEKERNFALGMWVVAGGAGAAFGPLIGGFLLEYFDWGAVFLINIPIVLIVIIAILKYIPKQAVKSHQHINIVDALMLITAILCLIYSLKSGLKQFELNVIIFGLVGGILTYLFIKKQINSKQPLLNIQLFRTKSIQYGFIISVVAMIALVGFELLISQKLQYVYQYSPLQAGLYILPFMLAVSVSGFFSTPLLNRFGCKKVAVYSLLLSAFSMYGLAGIDVATMDFIAIFYMVLLGLSILCAFLAATSAILSGAPIEQAASAGAIESMSYELGTGFGVTLFGLLASFYYRQHVNFTALLSTVQQQTAQNSIGETYQILPDLTVENAATVMQLANTAFVEAHRSVLLISSFILLFLAIYIAIFWKEQHIQSNI